MLNLLVFIKPRNSTLSQPLRMAAHILDWGNSLNQCCRRGKRLTMVMMFVGEVVLVLDGILVLFLPYTTYWVGVFRSHLTLIGFILLSKVEESVLHEIHVSLLVCRATFCTATSTSTIRMGAG
jgi:hypothetical protein